MKTAMQNHIADMKKIQEIVKSKNLDKDLEVTILKSIEGCIENAKSFLETEKEQIMEVVEFCDAHCDDGHFDKEGAIANIKSTFNL